MSLEQGPQNNAGIVMQVIDLARPLSGIRCEDGEARALSDGHPIAIHLMGANQKSLRPLAILGIRGIPYNGEIAEQVTILWEISLGRPYSAQNSVGGGTL